MPQDKTGIATYLVMHWKLQSLLQSLEIEGKYIKISSEIQLVKVVKIMPSVRNHTFNRQLPQK